MRHIKQFNESVTGTGWRKVDKDEINHLMSREVVDNFSSGEIGVITKVIAELGQVGEVNVCENPYRHKEMRLYMFTSVITLLRVTPISAGKVGRTRGPNSYMTVIKKPSNMIIFHNNRFLISILKSEDDMFFVSCNKDSVDIGLYVCDQLPGLLSAIKVILGK
jgi:hypothetical protein